MRTAIAIDAHGPEKIGLSLARSAFGLRREAFSWAFRTNFRFALSGFILHIQSKISGPSSLGQ